jgi:hypothetical protein
LGVWELIRRLRLQGLLGRLGDDLWSVKCFYELRCDLRHELPQVERAKIPIEMQPLEARAFKGFSDELKRCDGSNYLKVLLRTWYCRAGLGTLYVAFQGDAPVYAQWLSAPDEQRRIPWFLPGRFPALHRGEVLLEGAYTFNEYRRLGLMRDGMAQLLEVARGRGASAVITYVAVDNIPSLRGCADVGFVPNRVRVSTRRIVRWTSNHPVDDEHRRLWEAATAKAQQPPLSVAGPPEADRATEQGASS